MPIQTSYIGEGHIYLGLRSGGPMIDVGQVDEFKLEVSEETKKLKNYQGGGGLADRVDLIDSVSVSLKFRSLTPANLAMAMRGGVELLTSSAITDQNHTAYAGGFLPLDGIGPTGVSVAVNPVAWTATTFKSLGELVKPTTGTHFYRCTVAGATADTEPTTWPTDGSTVVDGTATWQDAGTMALSASEYQIMSAGIYIPEQSAKIAITGTPVKVSYTKSAGDLIQTLVNSGDEYRVFFDGINKARAGKPLSVDMFRVKFSATKDLSLIGDDFASLPLTAELLKDDSRTGTGISQFCTISMAR
ncbi:MAG: hypothetical protein HQM04_16655 [Magnetococcales bacterium]|nr:hypothetical protein [Magnetococcales bacterium]MBF0116661.1 hypothetical protein [Magnetococcales bacterium]